MVSIYRSLCRCMCDLRGGEQLLARCGSLALVPIPCGSGCFFSPTLPKLRCRGINLPTMETEIKHPRLCAHAIPFWAHRTARWLRIVASSGDDVVREHYQSWTAWMCVVVYFSLLLCFGDYLRVREQVRLVYRKLLLWLANRHLWLRFGSLASLAEWWCSVSLLPPAGNQLNLQATGEVLWFMLKFFIIQPRVELAHWTSMIIWSPRVTWHHMAPKLTLSPVWIRKQHQHKDGWAEKKQSNKFNRCDITSASLLQQRVVSI